jgi:transposase
MAHVSGTDRTQVMLTSLDLMVAQDSEARLIDEFVDGLDLKELGIGVTSRAKETASAAPAAGEADDGQAALFEAPETEAPAERATKEGRPSYDPRAMLKLYIYGNCNQIRSSRRLERACETNVEVMWLIGSLAPDFRTVANFRRDNAAALKGVFGEFVARVMAGVEPGFRSVDGTKVRASNAKDRNFTPSKLDDRIARLEGHIGEYLRLLDE